MKLNAIIMASCALLMVGQEFALQTRGSGRVMNVTSQAQLNRVLANNKNVVAEFLNPSCPHCIAFKKSGMYPELAQEFRNVKFIEISTAQAPDLHEKYNIEGTPTFVFFQNAKQIASYPGRVNKGVFVNRINSDFGLNG